MSRKSGIRSGLAGMSDDVKLAEIKKWIEDRYHFIPSKPKIPIVGIPYLAPMHLWEPVLSWCASGLRPLY